MTNLDELWHETEQPLTGCDGSDIAAVFPASDVVVVPPFLDRELPGEMVENPDHLGS